MHIYKKNCLVIIVFFSLCFSSSNSWSSTRFEYWWNSSFNTMQFREPISFIPYRIKLGNYLFGGSGFFSDNVIGSIDTLSVSPVVSINGEDFNYIDNEKYRSGLLFEIDFLSYNFFKDLQNTVDIMFGLGYKLRKPSSKSIIPYVEGNPDNWFSDLGNIKETVYYNPTIHDFNLNTTFIFQATNHFYPYFHFSYGMLQTYLFETEEEDLLVKSQGYSTSKGIGMNFISPAKNKNYNFHYGFEIRLDNLIFNEIKDLDANIKKINIEEFSLNFNIGIGYNGKSTIGDIGYKNMINSNYIEAIENFESFKIEHPNHSQIKKANKMIEFSNNKLAYQMLYNGIESYKNEDYDKAIIWYDKALLQANEDLKFEIYSRKHLIAKKLYNNIDNYTSNHSFDESMAYLNYIFSMSEYIQSDILSKKIDLLHERADYFVSNNKYQLAYNIYLETKSILSEKSYKSDGKINFMIKKIINDINRLIKDEDYISAFGYINFLDKIYSDNQFIIENNILFLKEKIDSQNLSRFQEQSQILINEVKNNFKPLDTTYKILIGDKYSKIDKLLGPPIKSTKRVFLEENYLMAVYSINEESYRLYFKNDILFEVEVLNE